MKDGSVSGFRIGEYLTDGLTGTDLVAGLNVYLTQVTVNGQVVTVADDH